MFVRPGPLDIRTQPLQFPCQGLVLAAEGQNTVLEFLPTRPGKRSGRQCRFYVGYESLPVLSEGAQKLTFYYDLARLSAMFLL